MALNAQTLQMYQVILNVELERWLRHQSILVCESSGED
jgi:hypothetical protein